MMSEWEEDQSNWQRKPGSSPSYLLCANLNTPMSRAEQQRAGRPLSSCPSGFRRPKCYDPTGRLHSTILPALPEKRTARLAADSAHVSTDQLRSLPFGTGGQQAVSAWNCHMLTTVLATNEDL